MCGVSSAGLGGELLAPLLVSLLAPLLVPLLALLLPHPFCTKQ